MDGYVSVEKKGGQGSKFDKVQNAKKSLNNYINQLKLHFDLGDDDLIKVLEFCLKIRKKNNFVKKWWHIWK